MRRLQNRITLGCFLGKVGDQRRQSGGRNAQGADRTAAARAPHERNPQATQTDQDADHQTGQGARQFTRDHMGQADARDGRRDEQRAERSDPAHPSILTPAKWGLTLHPGFKVCMAHMTIDRIGLLSAPERTHSGYRAYEQRALDRLSFVAVRAR